MIENNNTSHDNGEYNEYKNVSNQLHDLYKPAKTKKDGTEEYWYLNGMLHNENGPAVIILDKDMKIISEKWYIFDMLHNINGPADTTHNLEGITEGYYIFGKLHREDGPAIIKYNLSDEIIEQKFYFFGKLYNTLEELPKVEIKENEKLNSVKHQVTIDGEKILHNSKGPAFVYNMNIDKDSTKKEVWYLMGKMHRINGPAYIDEEILFDEEGESSSYKFNKIYYVYNLKHRINGAAEKEGYNYDMKYPSLYKTEYLWYIHNNKILNPPEVEKLDQCHFLHLFTSLFILYLANTDISKIDTVFQTIEDKIPANDINIIKIDYTGLFLNKFNLPLLEDFTPELIDNIKKYSIQNTIDLFKKLNQDVYNDTNNKILLLDSIVDSEYFLKIITNFSFDVFLTGSNIDMEFITHGRFSHVIHQYIIFNTIKNFIKSCENNRTHNAPDINKLYQKCCNYMMKKDINDIFKLIMEFMIMQVSSSIMPYINKIGDHLFKNIYLPNNRTIWSNIFDSPILSDRENEINENPTEDFIKINQVKLYDLFCIPDYMNIYLLHNDKWKQLYFLNLSHYYMSLLMANYIYHIFNIHNNMQPFREFIYPPVINEWIMAIIREKGYNEKISDHYIGRSNNLKTTSMYHTRQIFFNVLYSINPIQAPKFIEMFMCTDECKYIPFNYERGSDDYRKQREEQYLLKYMKYKNKYITLKKHLK